MKMISMILMTLVLIVSHAAISNTVEGVDASKQQGFEHIVTPKLLSTTHATEGKQDAEEDEC